MNSSNQALKSHQPALSPSDLVKQAPATDRTVQDMKVYIRRGHQARSEAFHSGFKALGGLLLALLRRTAGTGSAIEAWLFTPFYSGGRKS